MAARDDKLKTTLPVPTEFRLVWPTDRWCWGENLLLVKEGGFW